MKKHTASDCHLTVSSGIFKAHSSQSRPATFTARAGRWFSLPLVLGLAGLPASSLLAQDVAITGDVDPGTVASPTWDLGVTDLTVGDTGTGTLSISGAGAVSDTIGIIGDRVGSTGTVTVSGGSWTNSSDLNVGYNGNGTLNISGGAVSNVYGIIAARPGSTGKVTVSGGSWTNSSWIYMGRTGALGGNGTLAISGGAVSNTSAYISNNSTATVSGGSWTNSGFIDILYGSLTINGTGHVTNTRTSLYSGSTLNLDGGMMSTGQVSDLSSPSGKGTVNFNGGTLRLTGDQANLFEGFETGDVTLDAGGGTIDTQAFAVASSVSLDGTGSLTKEGTGSLTLTGANTYSGGTEMNGGILSIGADNHLGDSTGSLTFDFATLQTTASFSTSRDTTFAGYGRFSTDSSTTLTHTGTITGPGGLTKEGAGTLVLSGNNVFSGSTTISEGTLSLGSNTAAGTGGINLGAAMDYADGVSIANQISISSNTSQLQVLTGSATQSGFIGQFLGSRALEKTGAGTLILTGANTYSGGTTISAGTLQIGNGGTSGMIVGDVTNNANLAFNRTDDYTFNGTVSGSGNLIQSNGILSLSAAHTHTGSTVIEGGTLRLSETGSIHDSSEIDIAAGATFDVSALTGGYTLGASQTLSGNGTVVGNLIAEGTLAPGNSTGALHITGDLSLVPSSMIQMEIGSLSDFDRIVVSDTLTYDGTLGLSFLDGYIPTVGDTFDLFQGFSSHSGTFDEITVLASGYTTSFDYGTGELTFTAIPEPSSLVLLGISVFTITLFARRRPLAA